MFNIKKLKKGDWIEDGRNQKFFVEMWSDYIDWEKRREGENNWLVNQLKKYNCQKVFDSCAGDGCDAIYLSKQGFDMIANDIDELFVKKAVENAKKENIQLKITNLDWREFTKEIPKQSFDAVLCLGNSLSCLFDRKDQITALKNFYTILKDEGILIIDERNYQYILDNRKEILKGNYRYSGKYVYCGKCVHGKLIEIEDHKIKYELYDERTKKRAFLVAYPFKQGELKELLEESGFQETEQYSDYQLGHNSGTDFYQYICQK